MAMTQCKECKGAISTEAKVCPHCGAKPEKKIGVFGYIMAGMVALIIFISIEASNNKSSDVYPANGAHADRLDKSIHALKALKSSTREPESLQVEQVLTDQTAETICITYRARNGFGGMNYEQVSIYQGEPSKDAADWQRRCTGRMHDMTEASHSI